MYYFLAAIFLFSNITLMSQDQIKFSFDGEEYIADSTPLKSIGFNNNLHLVSFSDVSMVLEPGVYKVIDETEQTGRLYLNDRLTGLKLHYNYENDSKKVIDPFKGLKPEDMQFVRGVTLDNSFTASVFESLKHTDLEKLFVTLSSYAFDDTKKVPELPAKLQYLSIESNSSDNVTDFSNLKKLPELKYLTVELVADEISSSDLKKCTKLRYFKTSAIAHSKDLASLQQMAILDLRWSEISDISFAGSMENLQILHINGSKVKDLTPISELSKIEVINSNNTPAATLPLKTIKSLKTLKILSTQIDNETVAEFQKLNPQCKILNDWNSVLSNKLTKVTRVKIRTGGTCHTDPAKEKTLFELKKNAEIEELLKHLEVDSDESGFHCMCCGDPSFEFYSGDKLLLTIGFHHGKSIRWHQGDWPGDGQLKKKSAAYLCELLDKHGIKGPLAEKREEAKRQQAARKRWDTYTTLIPAEVMEKLQQVKSEEDAQAAFSDVITETSDKVKTYLKIYGCHNGSWNLKDQLEGLVETLIENDITNKDIVNELEHIKEDSALLRGASRWFLGDKNEIPEKSREKLIPKLAKEALTHPRDSVRKRALYVLAEINSKAAIDEIRKVFNGKYTPEKLPEEDTDEPGGMVTYYPGGDEYQNCPDKIYAAYLLCKLNDAKSIENIKKLINELNDKKSLDLLKKGLKLVK